jgi:hypothetical protein
VFSGKNQLFVAIFLEREGGWPSIFAERGGPNVFVGRETGAEE